MDFASFSFISLPEQNLFFYFFSLALPKTRMSLVKHTYLNLMPSKSRLPDVSPLLPKIALGLLLLPAQGITHIRKSSSLIKAPRDRAL